MNENIIGSEGFPGSNIKEAVCINAPRIYDSCSDKDCLEDLPLLLTKPGQCIADKAASVRINSVNVCSVSVEAIPVPRPLMMSVAVPVCDDSAMRCVGL